MVAVEPEEGELLFPVAVMVWSTKPTPENSLMLTAFAAAEGWETVIVSPATSAVTMRAEKTTVRTPEVPEPFAKSTAAP